MTDLCFPAPAPVLLPVADQSALAPVRRVYCVGRNYAEHAREMGHDPSREAPFFFQKNPDNLTTSAQFPYPPQTEDLHYEVELAVILHKGGTDITVEAAMDHVFGYAVALDMTRRDVQAGLKKAGRPWEAAKAVEHSAPIGPVTPAAQIADIGAAGIRLAVNGETRQQAVIADMVWSVPEIIATLSRWFTLAPGDVILTGTPAGVGAVQRGDVMTCEIDGLDPITVTVV